MGIACNVLVSLIRECAFNVTKYKPSYRMSMVGTIYVKGGKLNFHMRASKIKPSCQNNDKRKVKGKLYAMRRSYQMVCHSRSSSAHKIIKSGFSVFQIGTLTTIQYR